MSKEILKIYLAGDLHDNWREKLINYCYETYSNESLKNIVWLNPKRIVGQKHDYNVAEECVETDLKLIDSSDVVIVHLSRKELYATIVEILYSLEKKKKVFILLKTYYEDDNDALFVVGSNAGFPYNSPYWFLIQYTTKYLNCNIYQYYEEEKNYVVIIETILEEIFKGDLKRNQEKQKDVDNFLADLTDEKSEYIKTEIISRFKRDYNLIKKVKQKYKNCQLCGFTFKKKNGENYNEIHHVIPLSQNGKDAEINTLVLCANCHRQLHFANVDLSGFSKGLIKINGEQREIKC